MLVPAVITGHDGKRKRTRVDLAAFAADWRDSLVEPGNPHGAVNQAVSVEETDRSVVVVTTEGHMIRVDAV